MKHYAVLLVSLMLGACAATPVVRQPDGLFNDNLFLAPSERISVDDVFALSDEMKQYLDTEIARESRTKGRQQALFDSLYAKGKLKLDFDSATTRNAAQAFAARSGNCLSLVIMTAAFARQMGLPVRYQTAFVDDTWSRSGDIQFFIGHVNLTLGRHQIYDGVGRFEPDLTIDFLPPQDIHGLRTRLIGEETIVAMYMNNRAAELFTQGLVNNAYWWARAAIGQDPGFMSSYNTLGIIYQRHGNLAEAEKVLAYALERQPGNLHVMSNLVSVLNAQGRVEESRVLAHKLEQMDPNPPFSFFDRGLAAVRNGDFKAARDLFAKEVDRAPYYDEFHFWLAVAYVGLGEMDQARKQLTLAVEYSTTPRVRELYAAKLDRIKSSQLQ